MVSFVKKKWRSDLKNILKTKIHENLCQRFLQEFWPLKFDQI